MKKNVDTPQDSHNIPKETSESHKLFHWIIKKIRNWAKNTFWSLSEANLITLIAELNNLVYNQASWKWIDPKTFKDKADKLIEMLSNYRTRQIQQYTEQMQAKVDDLR